MGALSVSSARLSRTMSQSVWLLWQGGELSLMRIAKVGAWSTFGCGRLGCV